MIRKFIKSMALLLLLTLIGCSTLEYVEPADGPRARVRFTTDAESISVLREYDDANCLLNEREWMRLRVGPIINSKPKTLGLPLWNYHENASKEVYVEANKKKYLMFFGDVTLGAMIHSCSTPFQIAFAENNDYEVNFNVTSSLCTVSILQILPDGNDWKKKNLATFYNIVNETNSGCLTQLKKQRLY